MPSAALRFCHTCHHHYHSMMVVTLGSKCRVFSFTAALQNFSGPCTSSATSFTWASERTTTGHGRFNKSVSNNTNNSSNNNTNNSSNNNNSDDKTTTTINRPLFSLLGSLLPSCRLARSFDRRVWGLRRYRNNYVTNNNNNNSDDDKNNNKNDDDKNNNNDHDNNNYTNHVLLNSGAGMSSGHRRWNRTFAKSRSGSSSYYDYNSANNNNNDDKNNNNNKKSNGSGWKKGSFTSTGSALLALSYWAAIKDWVGYEKILLDQDPLKAKIKESWLLRTHGKRKEAAELLHSALHDARESKDEMAVTRIYDELANTYYELTQLPEAEKLFREVLARLVQMHGTKESDPDFIGVSLKLADIFARKGDTKSAEIGYRHCVEKQEKVVNEHLKKYLVSHGAWSQSSIIPDEKFGAKYSDPIALYGMCLEGYAHFLLTYCGEERMKESVNYMNEAIRIGQQIYGNMHAQTVHLMNNYGAACLWRSRFDTALTFLRDGVKKAVFISECAPLLPGYYCNYAEALFHTGDKEQALEYAQRAVDLAKRSKDPNILQYAVNFQRDLVNDAQPKGKKKSWW